jgi:hypothetical protein
MAYKRVAAVTALREGQKIVRAPREGVEKCPPRFLCYTARVSMATLQCVQYGTGRPSAPKDDDKTAAASFTKIMPNRLAASSVFRLL